MLTILFTAVIFAIIGYLFSKVIRKIAIGLYVIAAIVAVMVGSHEANIISLGYVPFGILLLVMFMGVLDKGKFRNQLLGVRGEYAIIGTILLFPHVWGYFEYYVLELGIIHNKLSFFAGLAALLVILPLTLTSFRKVRSKLGYKKWKSIHYVSYLFYALIATHLMFLDNQRFWLYVLIFGAYFVMKTIMLIQPKKAKQKKVILHNKHSEG